MNVNHILVPSNSFYISNNKPLSITENCKSSLLLLIDQNARQPFTPRTSFKIDIFCSLNFWAHISVVALCNSELDLPKLKLNPELLMACLCESDKKVIKTAIGKYQCCLHSARVYKYQRRSELSQRYEMKSLVVEQIQRVCLLLVLLRIYLIDLSIICSYAFHVIPYQIRNYSSYFINLRLMQACKHA